MERFSTAVENRIVRALGAYLRATPARELPVSVRRFGSFGSKALISHRDALMEALDDAALRARIVEWLDDGKTPLKRAEADLLRTVAEREAGWSERLSSQHARATAKTTTPAPRADEERLQREREKTKRARDDLQRLKAEAATAQKQMKQQLVERDRTIAELERRLKEAQASASAADKELGQRSRAIERERRKHERDLARSTEEKEKLQAETRAAKREARDLAAAVTRLEREVASAKSAGRAVKRTTPKGPKQRLSLSVPKGRLADARETLDEWLGAPKVRLLIDGYNVTKAKRGFGDLRLESQRERLIDEVGRLARKKAVPATIVFDGADLPAGAAGRRKRSPVAVEYSRPPEIGDDHLVAKLQSMPNDPVIVVTNDRELQERVRVLGATVATSDQLLRLIR